jgi:ATP-dependent Clp protease ATP-binding subunit ClpC
MPEMLCDRCGVRPAVAAVRRSTPGERPVVQRLCPVCLREGHPAVSGSRGGPFDDFFHALLAQLPGAPDRANEHDEPAPPPVNQVDITKLFSDATRALLHRAAERALDAGEPDLEPRHLLWAATHDDAARHLLVAAGGDPDRLRAAADEAIGSGARPDEAPALSPATKRTLLRAYQHVVATGASHLGPEHVVVALADDDDPVIRRLWRPAQIDPAQVRAGLATTRPGGPPPSSPTPTLDRYGRDLTGEAHDGRLDPVIGRHEQIEQTIEILSRRTKNNPVLVGDAGVGKTAIVEGIAQRIASGEVPDTIADRRLVAIDLGGMVAGSRYRGEFEERVQQLMDEVRAHADELLLFIDEIHTVVGAGAAEGAVDAANMLKPALARGELHVIGATTLDEYRRSVEKDAALERRFQPVTVPEPSPDDAVRILDGLKDRYEAFHRVRITDDAIDAAVQLSDRYVTDRFLPDKAIDLVDQAGARVKLRDHTPRADGKARRERLAQLRREKEQAVAAEEYERAAELREEIQGLEAEEAEHDGEPDRWGKVTPDDIADVVSRGTGIPVSQLTLAERDRLLHLEEHLHRRVVGQDEAVAAVAESVRRSRAGLGDPDRPVGSFLFLGPTGVGKTELARALAEALFGDEDLMVRFDMSEFQERHTVSRLLGSPPGYVGYEEAGQLTERVRRRPWSVVLLDEIEKAHPDVFNVLLQLLDDGRLTDAQGRTVDFRNTVVIMTSNLGAERIHGVARRVGFRAGPGDEGADFDALRTDLLDELRRAFRPEFLNRIDDVVVFRPLGRDELLEITRLLLDAVLRRLAGRRIEVRVDDDAVEHLARVGFDPELGARPLRRAIQREVENRLSTMVLDGSVDEGDAVVINASDGELGFDVRPGDADGDGLGPWEPPGTAPSPDPVGPSAPRA